MKQKLVKYLCVVVSAVSIIGVASISASAKNIYQQGLQSSYNYFGGDMLSGSVCKFYDWDFTTHQGVFKSNVGTMKKSDPYLGVRMMQWGRSADFYVELDGKLINSSNYNDYLAENSYGSYFHCYIFNTSFLSNLSIGSHKITFYANTHNPNYASDYNDTITLNVE